MSSRPTPEHFSNDENQYLSADAKFKLQSFLNSMAYLALPINNKAMDDKICIQFGEAQS